MWIFIILTLIHNMLWSPWAVHIRFKVYYKKVLKNVFNYIYGLIGSKVLKEAHGYLF